ncbi:MAG: hypothetical protein ACM3WR_13170 [Solirubrobacterales bacterium]
MTEPGAASGSVRSPLAEGWGDASRRALVAFGALLALAEAAALAVYALGGTGLSLGSALRVGGFELAAFHRIPLRLSVEGDALARLVEVVGGTARTARVHAELAVAPLAVTALAAWLLWRGGRAVAEALGGGPLARALHGAKVAPAYAAAVFVVCLAVRVRVPVLEGSATPGSADLGVSPWPALVLPLLLALVAGAAGGWWSAGATERTRVARSALAGGGTIIVAGLGLSYAGLFVAGVVRPDGGEAMLTPSTGRYFQTVFERPAEGAIVLAHHLALAPNEAAWVLVPAMGGCTGSFPDGGEPDRFLCYGRFPQDVAIPAWILPPSATAGPVPTTRFGPAPAAYLLFLLVPATAALLGGRRAVVLDLGDEGVSSRRAVLLGVSAGAVSALLVVVVGWFASISVSGSLTLDGVTDPSGATRLGPGLVLGGLLALGWGTVGGAVGALATIRSRTAARDTR